MTDAPANASLDIDVVLPYCRAGAVPMIGEKMGRKS
jgi:hypothetical protein